MTHGANSPADLLCFAGGFQQVLQLQRHHGPVLYCHRPASVSVPCVLHPHSGPEAGEAASGSQLSETNPTESSVGSTPPQRQCPTPWVELSRACSSELGFSLHSRVHSLLRKEDGCARSCSGLT